MKGNLLIGALALFMLAGIVGLSAHHYMVNEKTFLSYYQEHQLLHAHHFSGQIHNMLSSYQRVLEVIPVFTSNRKENIETLKKEIQTFTGFAEKHFNTEITFYDDEGIAIYSTNREAIGAYQFQSPFFSWAKKPENEGKMFVSADIREKRWMEPGGSTENPPKVFKILLAIPIHDRGPSEKPGHRSGGFSGVLSFSIDLREYILNELKDDMITPAQAWITDRAGRLLFYSRSPGQTGLNLRERNGTSIRSDHSLPYIKDVLENTKGTIDYNEKGAPRELIAFAPLEFQDLSWIVGYSSPYENVSVFVKKGLKQSLLLLGAVVFSFAVGFAYLMHSSRMKVRAEEESKHWRVLNEERRKADVSLERSAEKLRHLSSRLLTAQEEERRRISKELHDGLGGALVTLKLREKLLKKSLRPDQEEQAKECERTIEYIDQTMEEVYRLIRNLTPSALEHLGLSAAVQGLANDYGRRSGSHVTVNATNLDAIFSEEAQRVIYRVFQEAFTNIEKYAQASSVSVVIKESGKDVFFVIKDNGRGFDLERTGSQRATEKGLGLAIMEERVRTLEGDFEIWSEEGKGTEISFRIPKIQTKEGNNEHGTLPPGIG